MATGPEPLTPLEIAWGFVIAVPPGLSPRRALEEAVLPALMRPPCVVSFSGGRDSSAVLAVAAEVARREGLPLPIPFSLQFPGLQETAESEWQERVVRHLGVSDWERVQLSNELDHVGEVAGKVMRRHGLLWPPLAHMFVPALERAGAGSVLTGLEGDAIFGDWRWVRIADVLAGRAAPQRRDILRIAKAAAPPVLRRRAALLRGVPSLPWLRPSAQRSLARAWVFEAESEPMRWSARVEWQARRRFPRRFRGTLEMLARDTSTLVVHPLRDLRFLAALARDGGVTGWGDRTATMEAVLEGLLPREVLRREQKANYDTACWREPSREFRANWGGAGVDDALVDSDALRKEWSRPVPSAYTVTLLRAAWLAEQQKQPHGRQTDPRPEGAAR
jgi:asparagine synthase (glutamine-hydrolysing)